MKYIIKAILFVSLTTTTSCEKYLTEVPSDFTSSVTFYKTDAELNSAIASVYAAMGDQYGTYSRFLALEAVGANDEMFTRGSNVATVTASVYKVDAGYVQFYDAWSTLYRGIERANVLLDNIESSPASQKVKDQVKGEALFLRAYYHFVLAAYWGDIPLKITSTKNVKEINYPRVPLKQVFDQIILDMTTAEALVPTFSELGNYPSRVSKTAVQGILSRVCLHAAGRLDDDSYFTPARDWAFEVIDSKEHKLNPDYKQIFINQSADLYDMTTKEVLWEVEFNRENGESPRNRNEGWGAILGIQNQNREIGYMQGLYQATAVLYDRFEDNDMRRDWSISPYYYLENNRALGTVPYPSQMGHWGRYVGKWRREYQTKEFHLVFGGTNWPLLRYSDVLLMYAEAQNEIEGPTPLVKEVIKEVRDRANASDVSDLLINPKVTSDFIKEERSRELCFEGLRKIDLLRWGIFKKTMEDMVTIINQSAPVTSRNVAGYAGRAGVLVPYTNFSDRWVLFPIPEKEMSLNPAMVGNQNQGW